MNDSMLESTRPLLRERVVTAGLLEAEVTVRVKPLTPEEAIGRPERRDYPILIGKERVIEARVAGSRGQAFTDTPRDWSGRLADVVALPLDRNDRRAVYLATMNAVLGHLGRVEGTVHCHDEEPERCGAEIARTLRSRGGESVRVGLIGLNPAIAENLVAVFGPDKVLITDLNPDNVGRERFGVEIHDGSVRTGDLIAASDVVLVTGTTLVNDTFDAIWREIAARGKTGIVFGMTAAGVCALLDIERLCPCAGNG